MRYPHFLPNHGTIGFIAPAFGCNIEPYYSAFRHALNVFHEKGYQTKLGPNCFEGSGIGISNTPEKCAAEFMDAWQDPDSDILISCGGGELMCEILPYIDFETIKNTPAKWFQGYSDNTNLAFLLATMCDTAAIYGPCAAAFGMEPWHPAISNSFSILRGADPSAPANSQAQDAVSDIRPTQHTVTDAHTTFTVRGYDKYEAEGLKDEEHPLLPYNVTQPCIRKRFPDQDASFSGRLVGGCLDILCNLTGTKYDHVEEFNQKYKKDGVIWFMEACDLNVMSIRRAVWQLDQAGWFSSTKGFLIGRPYNGDEMFGLNQYHAVTDILGKYNVPILMDLDIGHIPPMMPLIEGSLADVAVSGNDISIRMNLL